MRHGKKLLAAIWPYRLIRMGLAALFIYGGAAKLLDPKAFALVISGYDLAPEALLPVVAVGLPLVETLAGIGLLLDITGALAIIAGLLALFLCVLGYGISLHLNVDCGCFGAGELARRSSLIQAFWRDAALLGMVVPYLYGSRLLRQKIRARQDMHANEPE